MATPDARAAKERKQKIFVVVGAVVLLALLAFQLPKLLGGSGSSAAPPVDTTTVGGETPPGAQVPTGGPVALVDTDRRLTLGPGQLGTFTVFRAKDPFVQQVVQQAPAPVDASPRQPAKPKVETPSQDFSAKKTAAAAVTVVSVNGVRHALEPGTAFPAADPVFVLVSEQPKAETVVVGVPGGKYANGARTTKLEVGKAIVLVNKTTGDRYRLKLVRVGDGKPATGKKR